MTAADLVKLHQFGAFEGIARIAAERQRQVEVENRNPRFDDGYTHDELVKAAVCYAVIEITDDTCPHDLGWTEDLKNEVWPWDHEWFKPKDRMANLVRAGALIAAEIDRFVRAEADPVKTQRVEPQGFRGGDPYERRDASPTMPGVDTPSPDIPRMTMNAGSILVGSDGRMVEHAGVCPYWHDRPCTCGFIEQPKDA